MELPRCGWAAYGEMLERCPCGKLRGVGRVCSASYVAPLTAEEAAAPIKHTALRTLDDEVNESRSLFRLDRGPGTRRRVESVRFSESHDALALTLDGGEVVDLAGETARFIASRCGPSRRANELSDQCGALRTENDALLRENAVLRRRVEGLERKAKR